jgi:hypothetical protein
MADMNFKDPLDMWQYRIFRILLFILFLATVYKILDHEFHLTRLIYSIMGLG